MAHRLARMLHRYALLLAWSTLVFAAAHFCHHYVRMVDAYVLAIAAS